ncbi:MAG: PASTA domain-containing protein [Actinobacteria bacterium]|nr:PASTA domain-containing protein [Actinomycetota bacterium]
MPDVVGMNLQSAQDTLQAAGFTPSDHTTPRASIGVRCSTATGSWWIRSPRAGTRISNHQGVDLGAVKRGVPRQAG